MVRAPPISLLTFSPQWKAGGVGDDRGVGFATIDVPLNESSEAVEIIEAAAKGDLVAITGFAENPDLFSCDYDSRTSLHLAASNGHLEIVKCILPHATHVFNNLWHLECMFPCVNMLTVPRR